MSDTNEVYQCPACDDPECRKNVVNVKGSQGMPVDHYVHDHPSLYDHGPPELDVWDTWDDEGGSIPIEPLEESE